MNETTGARLARARKLAGLTQKQLAERMQVFQPTASKQTVSQVETGFRQPTLDWLLVVAAALQVPGAVLSDDLADRIPELPQIQG